MANNIKIDWEGDMSTRTIWIFGKTADTDHKNRFDLVSS